MKQSTKDHITFFILLIIMISSFSFIGRLIWKSGYNHGQIDCLIDRINEELSKISPECSYPISDNCRETIYNYGNGIRYENRIDPWWNMTKSKDEFSYFNLSDEDVVNEYNAGGLNYPFEKNLCVYFENTNEWICNNMTVVK